MNQQIEDCLNYLTDHNIDYQINQAGIQNEKSVVVADWNCVHDEIQELIEEEYEIDWVDVSDYCPECNQHIHTTPSYYGDPPNFITTEWGRVCRNCVVKEPAAYVEEFAFESAHLPVYPKGVPSWYIGYLGALGFVPFHSIDSACRDRFESGFHKGQTDTAKSVAELVTEALGNRTMVFAVDSVGQFDVHFSVFIKKQIVTIRLRFPIGERVNISDTLVGEDGKPLVFSSEANAKQYLLNLGLDSDSFRIVKEDWE